MVDKSETEMVRDVLIKKNKMLKAQNEYSEAQNKWKMYLLERDKMLIEKRFEVLLSDKKPKGVKK